MKTIEQFRTLLLNNDDADTIARSGALLAQELHCPVDELGSYLGFTVYCNHPELCEELGLSSLSDLIDDVQELACTLDVDLNEANERLHKSAKFGINTDFYTNDEIPVFMFVDLNALAAER